MVLTNRFMRYLHFLRAILTLDTALSHSENVGIPIVLSL